MRRPTALKNIGFGAYEYQILGEISVISSIIENDLKVAVAHLIGSDWETGMTLTTHLSFASICDIALSLLPAKAKGDGWSLVAEFTDAIKACRAAYDRRSKLLHGPFLPTALLRHRLPAPVWVIARATARGKFNLRGTAFGRRMLVSTLQNLIAAHNALEACRHELALKLGTPAPRLAPPQTPETGSKANPQK